MGGVLLMFALTGRLKGNEQLQAAFRPKGFFTTVGYVGFLPDGRRLSFPTYDEYLEFISDDDAA